LQIALSFALRLRLIGKIRIGKRIFRSAAHGPLIQPAEFDALVVRELKENGELVKQAGIKAQ